MGTAFLVKNGLQDAFQEGRITDADLDAALTRLLTVRFRLGMFDPVDQQVREEGGQCQCQSLPELHKSSGTT